MLIVNIGFKDWNNGPFVTRVSFILPTRDESSYLLINNIKNVVFNDSNGNILSKNELRWHNDKRCYSMNEVNDAVKRHLDSEFEGDVRDPVVVGCRYAQKRL